MTAWTDVELDRIGAAEELEILSMRGDGTLRDPVIVWVVRVGDGLYVRAWRGRNSPWFRGAQTRHEGCIRAAGLEKEVTFLEESEAGINDEIDKGYRTKYRHAQAQYVDPMVAPQARAATIQLVPKSEGS
jgi:hypothetical protein